MSGYAIAHLNDIDELDDGRCSWRPVRYHFGITSFGVNAWTAREAGERIINEHDESELDSDEELYLVVNGRASFRARRRAGRRAERDVRVRAAGRQTDRVCTGAGPRCSRSAANPGSPMSRLGWEIWAPIGRLYEAGDYAEAADRGRQLLAADPPYAALYYNVACCESLAGRKDDALAHLRRAIELSDRTRDLARGDSDFDPIRNEPAFADLLAG